MPRGIMCVWALVAFPINPITTLDTPVLQPQRPPGQVFEKNKVHSRIKGKVQKFPI